MPTSMSLFVPGKPEPKGSWNFYGKRVVATNDKPLKIWTRDIQWLATANRNRACPVEKPIGVALGMRFVFMRPESHLKKNGTLRKGVSVLHLVKPDLDKLIRAVKDALSGVVYHDDSQVFKLLWEPTKEYATGIEGPGLHLDMEFYDIDGVQI